MTFKPILAITMGDPAGIGPEVVVKAVTDIRVKQSCYPVVLGSYRIIFSAARRFLKKKAVRRVVCPDDVKESKAGINVLDCSGVDPSKIIEGKITRLSGKSAGDCVFCAAQLALSGQIDAMVTAPLSKKGLHLGGYDFPGHTELLAYLTATSDYAMMFVADHSPQSTIDGRRLAVGSGRWTVDHGPWTEKHKVVLVTTHLPLSEISSILTAKMIFQKLKLIQEFFPGYFGIKKPKIGVCALNPHCGEEGILGSEEKRYIIPAIKLAKQKGIKACGPFSSDTIFSPSVSRNFDCILAMYHDQGLIPLKMRGLGEAVNVTIGLPIIRTSPDFGTALDIAGKGKADPKGMINAILLAVQLVKKRKM
jgi:4-hydroxythreonine-4-phosphate dehydrogenase